MENDNTLRFKIWLRCRGFNFPSYLDLVYFEGEGYGIKSKKSIEAGEIIFSLPETLLVTPKILHQSCISLLINELDYQLTPFQSLVIWLMMESCSSPGKSSWQPYIDVLPKDFNIPLFVPTHLLTCFPKHVREMIREQRRKVTAEYKKIKIFLERIQKQLKLSTKLTSFHHFRWAWSCVNTRCISMPSNQMALAPFLDFLNHDCHSKVTLRSGFDEKNKCYNVISSRKVEPNSQVLICYGFHSNASLAVEYGFAVPLNPHSFIRFSIDELLDCLENQVDENLLNQVISQRFHLDLCCTISGPSWCLLEAASILVGENSLGFLTKLIERRRQQILTSKLKQPKRGSYRHFISISSVLIEEELCMLKIINLDL